MKQIKQQSNKATRQQRGYTLIEVLVYSVILALFLFLIVQLFITIKTANANAAAFGSLQKNFRQIVSDLTWTIRRAENVSTPLPGESATSLSLNGGTILYQLGDGVLQKVENGQTWDLTSNEVVVSGLSFENAVEATQTATIRIQMKIESNYLLEGGRRLSESLQTTVNLR